MFRIKVIKIDKNEIGVSTIIAPIIDFKINSYDNTITMTISGTVSKNSVTLEGIINTDNVLSCIEYLQNGIINDTDIIDEDGDYKIDLFGTLYYDETVSRLVYFDDNIVNIAEANEIMASKQAIDMVRIPFTKYEAMRSNKIHIVHKG